MKKFIGIFLGLVMMMSFVVACAPKEEDNSDVAVDVNIEDIHEKVKEEFGEDYIPDNQMELEQLETLVGVKVENVEEYIAETPMISVNVDTFIAIEAKEGKGDAVEESLQAYRTSILEQSMMYPMNQAKVNAAKVVRHGDYVFFLMLGKYDDREDVTEEEALEFAKEEVERAENVINGFFE
jgi:uncharacterized protein DUF4358